MRITGKPQVFCVALGMILCVVCVGPVGADRVVCPVEADTYVLHGSMTSNGYPTANALRARNWVAAGVMVGFWLLFLRHWSLLS